MERSNDGGARVGAALVLACLSAGACGPLRLSPSATGTRRFYLTKTTVQGNRVLNACARGFHVASRFEVADPGLLEYDTDLGVTADDSGLGPPSAAAAYGPSRSGWIRTGGTAQFTLAPGAGGSALTNCAAWSSNSHGAYGTVAFLGDRFTLENGAPAPLWDGRAEPCDGAFGVWCVQNATGRQPDAPESGGYRHRGRGPD